MKTSEAIKMLKTQDVSDGAAYNAITDDLFERVPPEQVEGAQQLVAYYMYIIKDVCLAAIRELKAGGPAPKAKGNQVGGVMRAPGGVE